ncbi:uncharacterized protein [Nicotiana sylvestris]|uniref:uncharacterized protein n=1 Tax=Nicotiana sylvestris TaxID=4096 RepID=UPI00388CE79F
MLKHTKVSITRERTRDYVPDGTISFNDEDDEGIIQPDNDAMVISVLINKSRVKHVFIDPVRILNGINMACETTKGEITLPVNTAGTVQETKFYVIEGDMRYNALFGRPWIHSMREVLSTLHQALKFPPSGGIKMIF